MQKTKWHILSTAPLPETLVQETVAQNIILDVIPFIETKPVIDDKIATQIQQLFQKSITAVFTSSNAVTAVAKHFQKHISWRIYTVGNATATLIKDCFQITVSATAKNAVELAEQIIKDKISEVYFFCGNLRRDELPEQLREANILVHEIVVYETQQKPQLITTTYDAIIFYSPSAVHSFFSMNHAPSETIFFSIGNTTANAIQQHTNNPIIISERPDKKEIIEQVIQHFNTLKEKANE